MKLAWIFPLPMMLLNLNWLQAADNGEITAALLLDLSASFDLVDHRLLIGKLKLYRFGEASIQWFSSYLFERTQ